MANIVAQFCNTIQLGINHKKSYYTTTDASAPDITFTQTVGSPKAATKVPASTPVRSISRHQPNPRFKVDPPHKHNG